MKPLRVRRPPARQRFRRGLVFRAIAAASPHDGTSATATTAQLITLVVIATSNGGATSQRLGDFYDMEACRTAAARATLVGAGSDVHVAFACVPLTPVASSPLLPRR